jgi:type II secretory pathway pseudopilin PulG
MRVGEPRSSRRQAGFTYLWLLAAVAVLAIGMAIVGPMWAEQVQRQREAELLRVGAAYAQAIEHYYRMQPSGVRQLPHSIDDLLLDPRFPTPVRHLRDAYTDPMLPGQPMALVLGPAGELRGVASNSDVTPLMQAPWTDGHHALPAATPATRYRDWQFLANTSS